MCYILCKHYRYTHTHAHMHISLFNRYTLYVEYSIRIMLQNISTCRHRYLHRQTTLRNSNNSIIVFIGHIYLFLVLSTCFFFVCMCIYVYIRILKKKYLFFYIFFAIFYPIVSKYVGSRVII